MIKNDSQAKAKKQLEAFSKKLAALLSKHPEILLSGDRDGNVMASITPRVPYSSTVNMYVPMSSK